MPEFGQNLPAIKQRAIDEVNERIGKVRRRYITILPGQEMIYLVKEAEAIRYLAADPEPSDLTEYPMLRSEVGVTAPTAYELSQIFVNKGGLLREVAGVLENIRLRAVYQIEQSTNRVEVEAAISAFLTELRNAT